MSTPEGFEFRPANDNEMAQLQRLGNYVFAQAPSDDAPPPPLDPAWTQCAFKGQKIAAISGAFPFIVRLNGKTSQFHGVTMVGTEPEFRRRGLVRQLITDLLHRGKETGNVGSILLASKGAIYQRFGYGQASTRASYEFDPRQAAFQFPMEVSGRIERMTKDDAYPLAKQIFKEYARDRNMLALRGDVVWNLFFSDVEKEKAYCTVHFDENNHPDAYCIYSTKWETDDQELSILDFAYSSMGGYRAIWQNLCSHDLVGKIKWENVPEDDPAPGILLEPRCLNRKTSDGLWFRIIDVTGVLVARHYDVDGDIKISIVEDEICPWNVGAVHLSARQGQGSVESIAPEDADIICSINALASMVSGHASPTWLAQIGRIQVSDISQLGYYDALFATRYRPLLSFNF